MTTRVVPVLLLLLVVTCLQESQVFAESQTGQPVGIAGGMGGVRTLTDAELRQLVGEGCGGAGPYYKKGEEAGLCTEEGCRPVGPFNAFWLIFSARPNEKCATGANPGLTECYVAEASSRCAYAVDCHGDPTCSNCDPDFMDYLKRDTAMLSGLACP